MTVIVPKRQMAIFYDIENFQNPIDAINFLKKEFIDYKIVMQKAYTSWRGKETLRAECFELGVEPIEVLTYGSKEHIKNASDIALCVEVMDIVYTKKHIDTIVIASGDAGLNSLSRKLNELGKSVIWVSEKEQMSNTLGTAYDKFFMIGEKNTLLQTTKEIPQTKKDVTITTNEMQERLSTQQLDEIKLHIETVEEIFIATKSTLSALIIMFISKNYKLGSTLREGISFNDIYEYSNKYDPNVKTETEINKIIHKIINRYKWVRCVTVKDKISLISNGKTENEYIYIDDSFVPFTSDILIETINSLNNYPIFITKNSILEKTLNFIIVNKKTLHQMPEIEAKKYIIDGTGKSSRIVDSLIYLLTRGQKNHIDKKLMLVQNPFLAISEYLKKLLKTELNISLEAKQIQNSIFKGKN